MTRRALLALTLLPLTALVPALPAWAQKTPDDAKALQSALQDWVTVTLGPDIKLPPLPIQVTADGDHYDLSFPLGDAPDAPRVTGIARGPNDGKWTVENVRLPSPAAFSLDMPIGDKGAPAKMDYKVTIGDQSVSMLIDPSLKTASTSTSTMRDLSLAAQSPKMQQTSSIKLGSSTGSLQPSSNGRVNLDVQSTLEGYEIATQTAQSDAPIKVDIGKGQVVASITDASPDRLREMIHLAGALSALPPGPDKKAKADQLGETLLAAFADFATGLSIDESVDNLNVSMRGMEGSLHGVQFGFGVKGAGGILQARLDLGADGLTLPDLGLGAMAELIPTKLTIRPTVTGLPADALIALMKSQDQHTGPQPQDVMALFAHGPIVAGIENLTLDIAGAELTGLGKLTVAGPAADAVNGSGQITITNMDIVQQKIASEPELAQALPVVIFLKGIGRANGNQMVWDISFQNRRLLVNGTDMSALAGAAGGGGSSPQAAPQAQPPSTTPQPLLRRRQPSQ